MPSVLYNIASALSCTKTYSKINLKNLSLPNLGPFSNRGSSPDHKWSFRSFEAFLELPCNVCGKLFFSWFVRLQEGPLSFASINLLEILLSQSLKVFFLR